MRRGSDPEVANADQSASELQRGLRGGQLGAIFRYAGSPLADQVPADWSDKIMHGSLTVGDLVLMGGDVEPERYEEPKEAQVATGRDLSPSAWARSLPRSPR